MIGRNDPCFCGSNKKWKNCHYPKQPVTTALSLSAALLKKHDIHLKSLKEIEGIRQASQVAASILDEVAEKAKEGVTTNELNDLAVLLHKKHHAIAAPLHYGEPPFPKSICTSLNEVICHGIPDNTPLKEGDILNIDVTSIVNGFYGDCSKMVVIGSISPEKRNVVNTAYDCLMASIQGIGPGVLLSEIANIIEKIAQTRGCSVVDQFVGHGVGVEFHEGPQVFHSYNTLHLPLVPNMTFTIEPMINVGKKQGIIDPLDHWTARTVDLKPSAQYEHTLLITESGVEILTPWTRTDFPN